MLGWGGGGGGGGEQILQFIGLIWLHKRTIRLRWKFKLRIMDPRLTSNCSCMDLVLSYQFSNLMSIFQFKVMFICT